MRIAPCALHAIPKGNCTRFYTFSAEKLFHLGLKFVFVDDSVDIRIGKSLSTNFRLLPFIKSVAGILPDQLGSIRSINSCGLLSFKRNTSFFKFFRFTNGTTLEASFDLKSRLTNKTASFSDLCSALSFSKCGNSLMKHSQRNLVAS